MHGYISVKLLWDDIMAMITVAEGDLVPEFEALDTQGQKIKSSDLHGTKYVIYFYPKNFTPGCTIQADEFSRDYEKFKKNNIQIFGISPDDIDSHKKFCEKMKIKYVLLSDTDKKISQLFGVWGKKKFMGREYMGVTRSSFLVNEKSEIFKIYPKVKPAGHSQQVLNDFVNLNK